MVRQARTLRMLQTGTAAEADQQDQHVQDTTVQPPVVTFTAVASGQLPQSGRARPTTGVNGLRHETRMAADSFVAFLRGSDTASTDQGDQPGLERTVRAHSAFVQTVATLCATKMRNENMSAKSVCQAVGVMSAMWMLSPSMRRVTRMQREDIKTELSRRLDDRARTELDRVGGDATSLSRRWRRRIEAIESTNPAQREAFTASSAALTMIGLSENAAAKLRAAGPVTDQGAPAAQAAWDGIEAEHQAVVDKVYGLALADGVEPREVDELVRITLAQYIERDPDRAADFASLAYGKEVTGFHDANALPVPAKVLLRPRGPLSPDQHRERLAGLVHKDLGLALEQGNAEAFFDRLREHLGDDGHSPGDAALRADGLQAPLLRSIACREVMESLGEQHPQFQKSMSQIYGSTWSQAIVEDLRSNADLTSAASSLSHSMSWDRPPVDASHELEPAEPVVTDAMEYEPSL